MDLFQPSPSALCAGRKSEGYEMTRSAIALFRRDDAERLGKCYDREISYRFAHERTAEMTATAKAMRRPG